ncbi:MAG: PIN domain-containing protein, partial [Acidobacteriia bacterium]|nr:PIN domain-containing protein [Terriglobia bacterium]
MADTEAFGAHGAWVPTLAVVEAMRILEAIYDWPPARQSICLEMQLDHGDLVIQ